MVPYKYNLAKKFAPFYPQGNPVFILRLLSLFEEPRPLNLFSYSVVYDVLATFYHLLSSIRLL